MRTEIIQELVDVGVVFKRGTAPAPKWFIWSGKKHTIKKTEMTWKGKEGEASLLYFSVTDGTNVYELCFNQKTLTWSLEKVHVEG